MCASRSTEREPRTGEQPAPRADVPDPVILPARRAHRRSYRPVMTTASQSPTCREPHLDVLVLGAGQAGLALAWHLNRAGARYLVVDAAPEVGHAWRTRWDSLRLFTPSQYDGLPGTPFPAPADSHPTKDEVADYLAAYAQTIEIPLQLGTPVRRLTRTAGRFVAETSTSHLIADQVVVATGAFHQPLIPSVEGDFEPGLVQLHSSAYRNPSQVSESGRVLVVGAGNSGLQIAEELNGPHEVFVAAGSHPMAFPQRFAGHDLFWWLLKLGLMNKPADSRIARQVRARGDIVIGSDRKRLARDGVDFRGRLVSADGHTATFADATKVDVDAVVWATGFRPDFGWIDADVTTADGQLRHREGRTDIKGLWTLGQPWQRTRGSALLGFVHRDAEHIAHHIAAHVRTHVGTHVSTAAG